MNSNPIPEDSLNDAATHAGDIHQTGREQSLGDMESFAESLDHSEWSGAEPTREISFPSRYRIEQRLGRGGMGEVFKAWDAQLKRNVAVKRLRGEFSQNTRALERFQTEARSLAKLSHENIVQIFDIGQDQEGPFLVMELVSGRDLAEILESGPLPLRQSVKLTLQLCGGLSMAHAAKIVHRDIKPANILITEDGRSKLTDFGLARHTNVDTQQTQAGAVLGTLDFMPPEQRADSSKADALSDQWSLAATFYQMVTGEVPRVLDGDPFSPSLRKVLFKALKSKPEERYESIRSFAVRLKEAFQLDESRVRIRAVANEKGIRSVGSLLARVLETAPDDLEFLELKQQYQAATKKEKQNPQQANVPPLPDKSVDDAYRDYIYSTGVIKTLRDHCLLNGPAPRHPDALIQECLRLLTRPEFRAFFLGRWIGSRVTPVIHQRLKSCLELLEKWAFFYPEYRNEYLTVYNESAKVFKRDELDKSVFKSPEMKAKYNE